MEEVKKLFGVEIGRVKAILIDGLGWVGFVGDVYMRSEYAAALANGGGAGVGGTLVLTTDMGETLYVGASRLIGVSVKGNL